LILGLIFTIAGCFEPESGSDPASRVTAPNFALTRIDGSPVELSVLAGKTVILDFWATWCAPCEVQMPVLDDLWSDRGDQDVFVLGLSVDTDPAEDVIAWVDERGFRYPIAIADQELAIDYGVIGFPTLFVIDPQGRVHTQHTGVLSRPELDEILDEIAREPLRPPAAAEG
jgi:peroxiredoxin